MKTGIQKKLEINSQIEECKNEKKDTKSLILSCTFHFLPSTLFWIASGGCSVSDRCSVLSGCKEDDPGSQVLDSGDDV